MNAYDVLDNVLIGCFIALGAVGCVLGMVGERRLDKVHRWIHGYGLSEYDEGQP